MEISSALPDLNLGLEKEEDDDDENEFEPSKHRIPRVAYDKEKNNGDLSSIDIYKPYLNDEEEEEEEDLSSIPFQSAQQKPKVDR